MFQIAADEGVVILLGGGEDEERFAVLLVDVADQLPQGRVGNPRFDQIHQLGKHVDRIESCAGLTHVGIEAFIAIGFFDGSNFFDFQLRAEI